MVLRRQLAQERPRSRPWVRVAPRPASGTRLAVWTRGWRGILRWPARRIVRLVLLGAAAGVSMRGVWAGTAPLVVVAGLALWVAALDAVEPLAQEADAADRRDSYPRAEGWIELRHLAVPCVVMAAVAVVAIGAALPLGHVGLVLGVGGATLVPAATAAVAGAAVSVVRPAPVAEVGNLMPELTGLRAVFRELVPPVLATAGLLPVFAARAVAAHHQSATLAAANVAVVLLTIPVGVGAWVHTRGQVTAATRRSPGSRRDARPPDRCPGQGLRRDGRPGGPQRQRRRGRAGDRGGPERLGKDDPAPHHGGSPGAESGRVVVAGAPPGSLPARAATSYVPDAPVLYDDLSVFEHLEYVGRLHGNEAWDDSAEELVERLGLEERVDDLPARFSRGLRQKTSIALGLVRPFSLLLVDEPFVGLDAGGRLALLELLDESAAAGAAVVVATHQLEFVDQASRCLGLRDGRLVYDGPATPGPGRAPRQLTVRRRRVRPSVRSSGFHLLSKVGDRACSRVPQLSTHHAASTKAGGPHRTSRRSGSRRRSRATRTG